MEFSHIKETKDKIFVAVRLTKQGLNAEQIAERFGVSRSTVTMWKSRNPETWEEAMGKTEEELTEIEVNIISKQVAEESQDIALDIAENTRQVKELIRESRKPEIERMQYRVDFFDFRNALVKMCKAKQANIIKAQIIESRILDHALTLPVTEVGKFVSKSSLRDLNSVENTDMGKVMELGNLLYQIDKMYEFISTREIEGIVNE